MLLVYYNLNFYLKINIFCLYFINGPVHVLELLKYMLPAFTPKNLFRYVAVLI
jgi:hypothetical protein